MEYRKIESDEYNIYLINNKYTHTIDIGVYFTENVDKKKITYRNMLIDYMTYVTKNYDSNKKLIKKCQDLYSLRPIASSVRYGNLLKTKIGISTINSKYLDDNIIYDNILLLKEIILNPLVDHNRFNEEYFNIIKKEVEDEARTIDESPRTYANVCLFNSLDNDVNYNLTNYTDINILNEINTSNLYDSYLDMIKNSKIDIIVCGKLEHVEKIVDVIKNNFAFHKNKVVLNNPYTYHNDYNSEIIKNKEKKTYQQSKLSVAFKTYGLNEFENKYVLYIFNAILGGNGDSLLMRYVRKNESLCYFIGTYFNKLDNLIVLNSGLNKDNLEKVIELVNTVVEKIRNGGFTKKDVLSAKKELLLEIDTMLANNYGIMEYVYGMEVFGSDPIEIKRKKIRAVTKEDVIEVAKKIKMKSIFFLEGEL